MSKSIYDVIFNDLDELVDVLAHMDGSFLYRHYLDNIRLKLKQAQKQEKLLGLYKELSNYVDEKYLAHELPEITRLKILIKELENE